jgi:hypothetical protein
MQNPTQTITLIILIIKVYNINDSLSVRLPVLTLHFLMLT